MTWRDGPLVGFDLGATGKAPEVDVLVTAALLSYTPGQELASKMWLADPGRAVSPASVTSHNISTEDARRNGRALPEVLDEVVTGLAGAVAANTPIVGTDLAEALTLLDRNCRATGVRALSDRVGGDVAIRPLIDIGLLSTRLRPDLLVRTLPSLAVTYGVKVDEQAASAAARAKLTMRIAWAMHGQHEEIRTDARTLHARQARAYLPELTKRIAAGRRRGEVVDSEMRWPVKPHIPSQRGGDGFQPRLPIEIVPGTEQAVEALLNAGFTPELLATTERIF